MDRGSRTSASGDPGAADGAPARELIFISPHLDDVVLSLGGLVAQAALRQAQGTAQARVITVCAGDPGPGAAGALARALHRCWGNEHAPVAMRRQEDAEALSPLGVVPEWLPEGDAIYRAYDTAAALIGAARSDDPLRPRLTEHLNRIFDAAPSAQYYFPLGIGGHVDHRLIHEAGVELLGRGAEVVFYEEIPYVLTAGALDRRLGALGITLVPHYVDVTSSFPSKLRAAFMYRSQIAGLFATPERMFEALTAYAVTLSPMRNRCYERIWLPASGPAAKTRT